MEPAKFSIIAATCHGNRGAQAMLETVVGYLSDARPDLRFHVFSYYPRQDRRLITDPRVRVHSSTPLALVAWLLPWAFVFGVLRLLLGRRVLRLAPAAIRALGESRALIDLAGVAFIDGREKFLPFNILTVFPAWLLGTDVVKMSQAIGPFTRRLNRFAARVTLPMCRMVWARGGRTHDHLVEAGFPRVRFAQADDIAFNYQERWSLTDEQGAPLETLLERLGGLRGTGATAGIIGICPSSVVAVQSRKRGGSYEVVLADLVRNLLADGFVVVLFPNATRAEAGEMERNNDIPLIRRVQAACGRSDPGRLPLAVDFDVNAAGIKRVIGCTDIVLVSRFHAMVGALSLGVPAVVLGWSHKYVEVMARFGLENCVMDYQELDAAQLQLAVKTVFGRRQLVRETILQGLPEVQASARRPVETLLSPSLGVEFA